MLRKWPSPATVTALALVTACGNGPGTADDAGADTAADSPPECIPASEADLAGWWALRAFVRLEMIEDPSATVHVCDDPPLAMAVLTWVVQVGEPGGGSAPLAFRTCGIELPQVLASLADCSLEATFTAYLLTSEPLDASLPLEEHAGVLALAPEVGCLGASTDDIFIRVGIREDYDDAVPLPGWDLECAGTTALECVPGYETDVQDTDGDGNPGVTFEIDTDPAGLVEGVAWATLRHTPGISGTAADNTLLRGGLDPALEYDLVGSDASMAGLDIDTPTVKRNLPDFVPVSSGSSFMMVRVDGAFGSVDLTDGGRGVDCADVLAAAWLFE